jgi:hypothetical protein
MNNERESQMNVRTILCSVALSLSLASCGDKAPDDKPETGASSAPMGEITTEKELPSVLTEGLTPEEKSEMMDKIMPSAQKDGPTPEEKFLQLRKDADAGNAKAQNGLGVMYYTGEVITKDASGKVMDNDPAAAAGWFYRAAVQGYAEAQFNLGLMYANGEGVAKDEGKAVEWFKKAADQGNVDAQNNLGVMYYTGEGVPKDIAKAREWFRKAAAQGNADAKANLEGMK